MNATYLTQDKLGMYAGDEPGPQFMGAGTILGNSVYNAHGEHLGDIQDLVIDMPGGKIAYAVLSPPDGVEGQPSLLPVPFRSLILDGDRHRFVLHVTLDTLKDAPWFTGGQWPSLTDKAWLQKVHRIFGMSPEASLGQR